ncbi:hypothetical protein CYMTET_36650 [Cymbomonas tetramitiformis]|uniref:PROP1-like PPR domain-containing protein n=1 Tax=Cymbomonas tetramitiformis TaxID=36881 RepID=A0AAE0CHX3_9CHLO|nr:hypothetical protein CYMTET_36650 [Cymbomonas tetramitiformis]
MFACQAFRLRRRIEYMLRVADFSSAHSIRTIASYWPGATGLDVPISWTTPSPYCGPTRGSRGAHGGVKEKADAPRALSEGLPEARQAGRTVDIEEWAERVIAADSAHVSPLLAEAVAGSIGAAEGWMHGVNTVALRASRGSGRGGSAMGEDLKEVARVKRSEQPGLAALRLVQRQERVQDVKAWDSPVTAADAKNKASVTEAVVAERGQGVRLSAEEPSRRWKKRERGIELLVARIARASPAELPGILAEAALNQSRLVTLLKQTQKHAVSKCLHVFRWARDECQFPLNAQHYSTMVSIEGSRGRVAEAFELVEEMKSGGLDPTVHTYTHLINACAKAKDIDRAWGAYEDMQAAGLQGDVVTYSSLMDVCAKAGNLAMARHVLEGMRAARVEANPTTYSSLINAHVKSGDVEAALEAFQEMEEAGVRGNVVTYTSLIHVCASRGDIGRALEVYKDMRRAGVAPSVITYNTLLKGCQKSESLEQACEVYAEMKKAGVQRDEVTYVTLLAVCAKAGDVDLAFRVVRSFQRAGFKPNAFVYGCLADACTKTRDVGKALEVYEELQEAGIAPDAHIYSSLIAACADTGDMGQAVRILEDMRRRGLPVGVYAYSSLIHVCVKAGDMAKAVAVLEEMRGAGVTANRVTYNTLINGYSHAGRLDLATEVLGEMALAGIAADRVTYNTMLKACARQGHRRKALKLLREMQLAGIPADAISYTNAINACAKVGALEKAVAIFEEMQRDEKVEATVFTYAGLINACAERRDVQRAQNFLVELEGAGLRPNALVYNSLLKACAKSGRLETALEVFQQLQHAPGVEPNEISYNTLIDTCAERKDPSMALQVFEKMQQAGIKSDAATYGSLIDACEKSGCLSRALNAFAEWSLNDLEHWASGNVEVLEVLWSMGHTRAAVAMTQRFFSLATLPCGVMDDISLDLRSCGPGSSQCLLILWLALFSENATEEVSGSRMLKVQFREVQSEGESGDAASRDSVMTLLRKLKSPFRRSNSELWCMEAPVEKVRLWLASIDSDVNNGEGFIEAALSAMVMQRRVRRNSKIL